MAIMKVEDDKEQEHEVFVLMPMGEKEVFTTPDAKMVPWLTTISNSIEQPDFGQIWPLAIWSQNTIPAPTSRSCKKQGGFESMCDSSRIEGMVLGCLGTY